MNRWIAAGGLAGLAAGGALLSFLADGGGLALPLGGAAGAAAAAALGIAVGSRRAPRRPGPPAVPEGEPERLRAAMGSGPLGRAGVIARLRTLEGGILGGAATLSPDEEARILRLSPKEFRRWLEERLDRLEAAS